MTPDERVYRAIVEAVPEGIWLVSPQGHTIFCTNRMAEILGTDIESLARQTCFECVFPADLPDAQKHFADAMAGHIPPFDFRLRRSDGSAIWVSISCRPMYDDSGDLVGLLGLFADISERRRAEQALRESEELRRLAMEAGRMFAFEWDPSTDEVRRSDDSADIIGIPGDTTRDAGRQSLNRVHPEDRERLIRTVRGLTPANDTYGTEYRFIQPGGQIVTCQQNARAFFDDSGRMIRLIGTTADITANKRAEAALRESELRYKEVFDITSECIFLIDVTSDGRFKFAEFNPAEEKAVGLSNGEVSGKFIEDVVGEEIAEQVFINYRRCLEAGALINYEEELDLPIGRRHFNTNLIPMRNAAGRIHRIVGVARDITEQRQMEAALQTSEQRLRTVVSSVPIVVFALDRAGIFTLSEGKGLTALGRKPGEAVGLSIFEIYREEPQILDNVRRALAGETLTASVEVAGLAFEAWYCPLRDQSGAVSGVLGVAVDITKRLQAEQQLRASEERWQLALRGYNDGLWDWDARTNQVFFSPRWKQMLGYEDHELENRNEEWEMRVHPEDLPRVKREAHEHLERKTAFYSAEYRIRAKDGIYRWVHARGQALWDEQGRPIRMVGSHTDITERKWREAALLESEERFRRVFEEGPLGVGLVGKDYRFMRVNSAFCRLMGYSETELLGMSFTDITHPDDLQADLDLAARLYAQEVPFYRIQKRYLKKSGETIWVNLTATLICDGEGQPLYGLAMIEDITEVKRTQEEAFARQKMESLGTLTGGIAHDFNNLLGSILADAELAEINLAAGSSADEELQRIKTVAIHGAEIVRELMIYSGQEKANLAEPVDVSRLVKEMLELLKVSISKHAIVETDLPKNLPTVRGNAPQIRQVVMNLIINASEAIGEKDGVINVTTSHVRRAGDSTPNSAANLPEGDYLQLEVSDTGCGMTEDVRAKIFDPFFTTKFAGRGLGLAVVQAILRDHGGAITLVSSPGQGTTFQILLPVAGRPAEPEHNATIRAPAERVLTTAAATVLLVEDEETLRLAVSKMLRKQGFSVLEADNGSAAVDLFRRNPGDISVILLDVTLPGISSREVIEEAGRIRPDIKIILTSAYSREIAMPALDLPEVKSFIRKPFRLSDLVQLLRDTLSS